MTLSATEQYLLELINRARLNPGAEAKLYGIDLNANLAAGTITNTAKQALAANEMLEQAAVLHSQWMLAADVFSHTGQGGSSPGLRIEAQGYDWWTYGENIAWSGTTGTLNFDAAVAGLHRGLFLSAGHRTNLMGEAFREVGLGAEAGQFTTGGRTFNAAMLTEVFATASTKVFLTGVAYDDSDANGFYSIGEGRGSLTVQAQGGSASSSAAGGYQLALDAGIVAVTGTTGTRAFSVSVDLSGGNVKLDLVGGTLFKSSGSLELGTGVNRVTLLGLDALSAKGNAAANVLNGNVGSNVLNGMGGNDRLFGAGGHDSLVGGDGNDWLSGGNGRDTLTGGAGADTFVFGAGFGLDRVTDFNAAQGDRIELDDALWGTTMTAEEVVSTHGRMAGKTAILDFGTHELHLANTSLTGLAEALTLV